MRSKDRISRVAGGSRSVWSRALLIAGLAAVLFATPDYGQSGEVNVRAARNTAYAEIGGAATVGSLNYERLILADRIALRVGIFYLRAFSEDGVSLPVTASALFELAPGGIYAEAGVGVTYIALEVDGPEAAGTALAGLRLHPLEEGLFLRGAVVYTTCEDARLHPGVAIGYSF